jgi:hypothetical protein
MLSFHRMAERKPDAVVFANLLGRILLGSRILLSSCEAARRKTNVEEIVKCSDAGSLEWHQGCW